MTRRAFAQAGISLSLLLVASCGGSEAADRAHDIVRVDSAGVEIVTVPPGAFEDTVSSTPLVSIGAEGDPDYEFFRLATVLPLGSGNLVVANGGTRELKFFDSSGTFIRSVGRSGEGPAEFGFLSTAWLGAGDSVTAHDPRRRRLVTFDSAGVFVGGKSFAEDVSGDAPAASGPCIFPGLAGLLRNGARVVRGWGCMMFEGSAGMRPTEQTIEIVRTSGDQSLGRFDVAHVWERGSNDDPRNMYSQIPFLGSLTMAVGPDRVFVSEGAEYEIKVFDSSGRLTRIFREAAAPPAVTDSDRASYLATASESGRPHPDDVPFPERFGSYAQLLVSHEGDLWARRMRSSDDGGEHWVVFSKDSGGVRRVVVPEINVESIRNGRIYGHVSDSLGLQTVVVLDAGGSESREEGAPASAARDDP